MSYMKYLNPIFNDDPSNHLDYDPKSHILDPQEENDENIRVYINQFIQQNPKLTILILYILFTIGLGIGLGIIGIHTIHYPQIKGVI